MSQNYLLKYTWYNNSFTYHLSLRLIMNVDYPRVIISHMKKTFSQLSVLYFFLFSYSFHTEYSITSVPIILIDFLKLYWINQYKDLHVILSVLKIHFVCSKVKNRSFEFSVKMCQLSSSYEIKLIFYYAHTLDVLAYVDYVQTV